MAQKNKLGALIQEQMARKAIADPFFWLTQCTRSKDEQARPGVDPYRPFPPLTYLLLMMRFMLDFDEEESDLWKSRTMMASWTASAISLWYAATHPATKVVIQSQDEDRAVHDVQNCKILWENSIERLKQKWPLAKSLDKQPYNKLELANGSTIIAIPGDPKKIKSEHPTIYFQDESAIMVDGERALNEAKAARCLKTVCVSSADVGWYADKVGGALPIKNYVASPKMAYIGQYVTCIDGLRKNPVEEADASYLMHGVRMLRTPKALGNVPIMDLDIEADPKFHDPEKMAELEAKFQPRAYFLKEIKRQAYALSGATLYPEFAENIHVVPDRMIPRQGTLYMSLDPHPRTPHAALWLLIDKFSDWWIYRELWPSKIRGVAKKLSDADEDNQYTIREYAETIVEMLEGNEIEWHKAETDDEYGIIRKRLGGEQVFLRFMDQAGKGFVAHVNELETESYSARYNRFGLQFNDPKKAHSAGEDAIHELLKERQHDLKGRWPRIHISELCVELIHEFKHARYQQMKRIDDEKDLHQTAAKARMHMLDNLRYLATSNAAYIPSQVSERTKANG